LQEKLESSFKENETIKRKLVSIDELRADRDRRIDALRLEIGTV
jgi:hypothetical protein